MPFAYRPDIDGLRAIAILLVMVFHAFPKAVPGGFAGVDVFFVISGFLISSILFRGADDDSFSLLDFYGRRARRLFPALVAVLAVALILGWWLLLPLELKNLARHVSGGTLFLTNFFLWGESGYFDEAAETKPLLHLWSLGIEEQFYLAFPLLIWLVKKARIGLLWGTAIAGALSLACHIWLMYDNATSAFYLPHARFWELLAGAVLAHAAMRFQHSSRPTRPETVAPAAGLFVVLFGALTFGPAEGFSLQGLLVPVAGAALIIAAGPAAWTNSKILSHAWLRGIGKISYPLYLWHWVLLCFAGIISLEAAPAWQRLGLMALATALAYATYRFVERPIREGGGRRGGVFILASLMATLGLTGAFIHGRAEVFVRTPFRLPGAESALLRFDRLNADPGYYNWLRKQRRWAIRYRRCHLGPDFPNIGFAPECLVQHRTKPNVLVIGDSTGGDVAAALRQSHPHINFLQNTGAGCVPTTKFDGTSLGRHRRRFHDHMVRVVSGTKLDGIVIVANWTDRDDLVSNLESVLQELNALNGTRLILVGPTPRFRRNTQALLSRRNAGATSFVSGEANFQAGLSHIEERMRSLAHARGVTYVDRLGLLCPDSRCPLLNAQGHPYFVDQVHLTTEGMRYFGKRVFDAGVLNALYPPPPTRPRGMANVAVGN